MKKEKCWLYSFFKKLEEANDFIKFSIDIPDNVYIMADIQNIKRVFNNLFQNAIDNNATKIMIRLHEAQLLIENTGKEIPPETEKKIFDKEFSTKPYGSGLGLHIVREILLHHNARIELISANPVIFSISFKEVEYEIN